MTSTSELPETPVPSIEGSDAPPSVDWDPADIDVADDPGRVKPRIHLSEPEGDDPASAEPKKLSRDAFVKLFVESFGMPKLLLGEEWAPLDIQPGEEQPAEVTGGVLYDWIERFAPWAIPSEDMVGFELIVAAGFLYGKYRVAMAIVDARRARKLPLRDTPGDGQPTDTAEEPAAAERPAQGVQFSALGVQP